MEEKIELIEKWRNWLWQLHLRALDIGDAGLGNHLEAQAFIANRAIGILNGDISDNFVETVNQGVPRYEQYKYGEYPE